MGDEADETGRTPVHSDGSRGFALTASLLSAALVLCAIPQLLPRVTPGRLRSQGAAFAVLWPQNWDFFANAASTEVTVAYRVSPGGAGLSAVPAHQMSEGDLWGLSRSGTTQVIETQYLADLVPPPRWIRCGPDTGPDCVAAAVATAPLPLRNTFQTATLCGRVVLVVERPVLATPGGATGTPSPSSAARQAVEATALQVECPA